jgi:hypothetical protein
VAELLANRGILLVGLVTFNRDGSVHGDVLQVSPCELGANLKRQSKNTSSKRRGSRCTTVSLVTAVLSDIGCVLNELVNALDKGNVEPTIASPLPLLYVTTN